MVSISPKIRSFFLKMTISCGQISQFAADWRPFWLENGHLRNYQNYVYFSSFSSYSSSVVNYRNRNGSINYTNEKQLAIEIYVSVCLRWFYICTYFFFFVGWGRHLATMHHLLQFPLTRMDMVLNKLSNIWYLYWKHYI